MEIQYLFLIMIFPLIAVFCFMWLAVIIHKKILKTMVKKFKLINPSFGTKKFDFDRYAIFDYSIGFYQAFQFPYTRFYFFIYYKDNYYDDDHKIHLGEYWIENKFDIPDCTLRNFKTEYDEASVKKILSIVEKMKSYQNNREFY